MADQKSSRRRLRCSAVRAGTMTSGMASARAGGSKSSSSISESKVLVPPHARFPFFRRDEQFQFLGVTQDRERRGHPDFRRHEAALKLVDTRHRLVFEREDDVTLAQTRFH